MSVFVGLTHGSPPSPAGRETWGAHRPSSQQHSSARSSRIRTHTISWPTGRLHQWVQLNIVLLKIERVSCLVKLNDGVSCGVKGISWDWIQTVFMCNVKILCWWNPFMFQTVCQWFKVPFLKCCGTTSWQGRLHSHWAAVCLLKKVVFQAFSFGHA